jgi:MYXO-CTERM domain-containing protein
MKTNMPFLPLLTIVIVLLGFSVPRTEANVVTYIDFFTTTQTLTALNSTTTNTVAASNAIGGFRTFTLSSTDNDPELGNTTMRVSTNAPIGPRYSLSTPTDATSSFEIKWGGANGTAGLGGVDFRGGIVATNFSLTSSTLNFFLRSADIASTYAWTFIDTNSNVASYAATFPSHSSTNPAISYAISLASFSGSGIIDWSSINFITLSGGGLELDLSMPAPLSVTAQPIPEPGTWAAAALLLGAAAYTMWRRRQNAVVSTPAAA